ncbi:MAG: hypothetical protein EXX96DRAFT_555957 [Benjaminiella poitrasii]|nr:MAG: hypothetical protein EXX96DRAFT_555957 [Benjaminiella poitrasii]
MDNVDQAIQSLLAGIPTELHLLTAVEIINNALANDDQDDDLQLQVQQALSYLRFKAAKGDIEAKIKLSTILDRRFTTKEDSNGTHSSIPKDTEEANMWARSVFDRRLSAALMPCAIELISVLMQQTDDTHLLDRLIERINLHDNDNTKRPMKPKVKSSLCYLVGLLLLDQDDVARGMEYFTRASDLNHEAASVELAKILSDPYRYPDQYDMQRSLAIYEAMADRRQLKDVRALTDLAHVYYEGSEQVERDLQRAYRYARRMAELSGEPYCQFIVGDVLLSSEPGQVQQAIFWLTQSADQGFPMAIETLSRIYVEGKVVKKDYEMAHHWCLMGDDIWPSGLGYCQTVLGDMYREGLGVPKDLIRSFEYYQKAATQQDAPQNYARYMLGEMFFKADGWEHNLSLATEYYKMAANENYEPACKRLEELRAIEEEENKRLIEKPRIRPGKWKIWTVFGNRRKNAAV